MILRWAKVAIKLVEAYWGECVLKGAKVDVGKRMETHHSALKTSSSQRIQPSKSMRRPGPGVMLEGGGNEASENAVDSGTTGNKYQEAHGKRRANVRGVAL